MDAQGLGRTHPLTPTRRLKQHTHAYNPRPALNAGAARGLGPDAGPGPRWAPVRREPRRRDGIAKARILVGSGPYAVAPTGVDPVTFRFSVERSTN